MMVCHHTEPVSTILVLASSTSTNADTGGQYDNTGTDWHHPRLANRPSPSSYRLFGRNNSSPGLVLQGEARTPPACTTASGVSVMDY